MKKLTGAVVALLLTATAVGAQTPSQVYTRPVLPSSEALARLNLDLAWHVYVPTGGRRDGITTIQLQDTQLFVQTRSNAIAAVNAETGVVQWRAQVGRPYSLQQPVGTNTASVFVTNGTTLYALDRGTGHLQWQLDLPTPPSSAPVAEEDRLYLNLHPGKVLSYRLPRFRPNVPAEPPAVKEIKTDAAAPAAPGAKPAAPASTTPPTSTPPASGRIEADRTEPDLLKEVRLLAAIDQPPLLAPASITLIDTLGAFTLLSSSRLERQDKRFPFEQGLAVPAEQYGGVAYLAFKDFNLYAMDLIDDHRLLWRFVAGAPFLQQPVATDTDLFIVVEGSGLHRIDRESGRVVWPAPNARGPDVARFLAANDKLVYARDRSGRLLVLDRARGTLLSTYDLREYAVPFTNDLTDRLYLAANDGLVICLHDHSYPSPLRYRKPPEKPKAAPGPGAKPEPKPAEKPMEDKEKMEKKDAEGEKKG